MSTSSFVRSVILLSLVMAGSLVITFMTYDCSVSNGCSSRKSIVLPRDEEEHIPARYNINNDDDSNNEHTIKSSGTRFLQRQQGKPNDDNFSIIDVLNPFDDRFDSNTIAPSTAEPTTSSPTTSSPSPTIALTDVPTISPLPSSFVPTVVRRRPPPTRTPRRTSEPTPERRIVSPTTLEKPSPEKPVRPSNATIISLQPTRDNDNDNDDRPSRSNTTTTDEASDIPTKRPQRPPQSQRPISAEPTNVPSNIPTRATTDMPTETVDTTTLIPTLTNTATASDKNTTKNSTSSSNDGEDDDDNDVLNVLGLANFTIELRSPMNVLPSTRSTNRTTQSLSPSKSSLSRLNISVLETVLENYLQQTMLYDNIASVDLYVNELQTKAYVSDNDTIRSVVQFHKNRITFTGNYMYPPLVDNLLQEQQYVLTDRPLLQEYLNKNRSQLVIPSSSSNSSGSKPIITLLKCTILGNDNNSTTTTTTDAKDNTTTTTTNQKDGSDAALTKSIQNDDTPTNEHKTGFQLFITSKAGFWLIIVVSVGIGLSILIIVGVVVASHRRTKHHSTITKNDSLTMSGGRSSPHHHDDSYDDSNYLPNNHDTPRSLTVGTFNYDYDDLNDIQTVNTNMMFSQTNSMTKSTPRGLSARQKTATTRTNSTARNDKQQRDNNNVPGEQNLQNVVIQMEENLLYIQPLVEFDDLSSIRSKSKHTTTNMDALTTVSGLTSTHPNNGHPNEEDDDDSTNQPDTTNYDNAPTHFDDDENDNNDDDHSEYNKDDIDDDDGVSTSCMTENDVVTMSGTI